MVLEEFVHPFVQKLVAEEKKKLELKKQSGFL